MNKINLQKILEEKGLEGRGSGGGERQDLEKCEKRKILFTNDEIIFFLFSEK